MPHLVRYPEPGNLVLHMLDLPHTPPLMNLRVAGTFGAIELLPNGQAQVWTRINDKAPWETCGWPMKAHDAGFEFDLNSFRWYVHCMSTVSMLPATQAAIEEYA